MHALTVLITGATAGIGRTTALLLARTGYRVIATGRREAALAEVVAESGGVIIPVRLDVDDAASIAAAAIAVDEITNGAGLDVLVNNAGYATVGALSELSDAALRAQFETNVFGLMAVTRAFLPAMLARGSGRVLNVSSVSGRVPAPMLGAYHGSKYALEAMSDALRMELAPLGIHVVLIEPGTINTEFANRTRHELAHARPASSHFDPIYARVDSIEATFARMATGPEHVARAIARAIRARRPSARYVAPRRFHALILLAKLLPTCLYDRLMMRTFGLNQLRPAIEAPR
jgi:short-subunit dehydrogenase